jgi:hypothetical protein
VGLVVGAGGSGGWWHRFTVCARVHVPLQIPARAKRLRVEVEIDSDAVYENEPTVSPKKNPGRKHLPAWQFPLHQRRWFVASKVCAVDIAHACCCWVVR